MRRAVRGVGHVEENSGFKKSHVKESPTSGSSKEHLRNKQVRPWKMAGKERKEGRKGDSK